MSAVPSPNDMSQGQMMHDDDLKQQDSPTGNLQGGVRRRPSRAGTRSVSTLTAAQLERKRANDREAQRAIRQRTKENTERLERRVADLEAQLEAVGAGGSTQVPALLERIRQNEHEISMLRMRLEQAALAMGVDGSAALEDPNARVVDPIGNANNMPLLAQPQVGQAQMAADMLNHGGEIQRPGSNYGYRPSSGWQQASGYGAHTGVKRDTTPANTGDHSPESMNWSGNRNRASDHHQPTQQAAEYAHMLSQQQPMRPGSQQPMPYQPGHEQHAYPLPPQGNPSMTSYSPAHSNHAQPYNLASNGQHPGPQHHTQQSSHPHQQGHPQQSPHIQHLPPPHGSGDADRDGSQQVYYPGFPRG